MSYPGCAEKLPLPIYFLKLQQAGHVITFGIGMHNHMEAFQDYFIDSWSFKGSIYKMRNYLKWHISCLYCPTPLNTPAASQKLESHKKVFKREHKTHNWDSLRGDLTNPRQTEGPALGPKELGTELRNSSLPPLLLPRPAFPLDGCS